MAVLLACNMASFRHACQGSTKSGSEHQMCRPAGPCVGCSHLQVGCAAAPAPVHTKRPAVGTGEEQDRCVFWPSLHRAALVYTAACPCISTMCPHLLSSRRLPRSAWWAAAKFSSSCHSCAVDGAAPMRCHGTTLHRAACACCCRYCCRSHRLPWLRAAKGRSASPSRGHTATAAAPTGCHGSALRKHAPHHLAAAAAR